MSPTLGLVAFVPATRPLENVLHGPISEGAYQAALEKYQRFIEGVGSYVGALGKGTRHEVVKNFEQCQSLVPWDGLREALLRYAGEKVAVVMSATSFQHQAVSAEEALKSRCRRYWWFIFCR